VSLALAAPQALTTALKLSDFESGEPSLDDWLKRRAVANQLSGASRTFVVADEKNCVYGYYALAAGAVSHSMATSAVRRNMPDPIPVIVLGRLAVDCRAQGIKLGAAMLQDALNRTIAIAQNTGVRALLVHALHDRAKRFYQHYGFQESPQQPLTLLLSVNNKPTAKPGN